MCVHPQVQVSSVTARWMKKYPVRMKAGTMVYFFNSVNLNMDVQLHANPNYRNSGKVMASCVHIPVDPDTVRSNDPARHWGHYAKVLLLFAVLVLMDAS